MSDELAGWSPEVKVVFSDEELVQHLRRTAGQEAEPAENWWTFYSVLPKQERDRLAAEAASRLAHGGHRRSGYHGRRVEGDRGAVRGFLAEEPRPARPEGGHGRGGVASDHPLVWAELAIEP